MPQPYACGKLAAIVEPGKLYQCRIAAILGNLTRGDLHHQDSIADHIGGALLALGSFRHRYMLPLPLLLGRLP